MALEDRYLLRVAVFSEGEIIAGETANDGAVAISDVDEDIDQFYVDVEGGFLCGCHEWRER